MFDIEDPLSKKFKIQYNHQPRHMKFNITGDFSCGFTYRLLIINRNWELVVKNPKVSDNNITFIIKNAIFYDHYVIKLQRAVWGGEWINIETHEHHFKEV